MPFPNISWWSFVMQAEKVVWDVQEHFEKMTYRNRYEIAGANGLLKMSIPVKGGREHKSVMAETQIANQYRWQQQHWRTIVSAYSNAPYFYFYETSLRPLFLTPFQDLADFNLATIHWLKQQSKIAFEEGTTERYQKTYPDSLHDLRHFQLSAFDLAKASYHQVFQQRNGFIPNLSLLDLLFAEGPYTSGWLKERMAAIRAAVNRK